MADDLRHIRNIVRRVRCWADRKAVVANFPSNLNGFCAIGSRKLYQELRKAGYRPRLAYKNQHCFVIIKGYIADVTATQFCGPRVTLRSYKRNNMPWHWTPDTVFTSMAAFDARLKQDRWPKRQSYLSEIVTA